MIDSDGVRAACEAICAYTPQFHDQETIRRHRSLRRVPAVPDDASVERIVRDLNRKLTDLTSNFGGPTATRGGPDDVDLVRAWALGWAGEVDDSLQENPFLHLVHQARLYATDEIRGQIWQTLRHLESLQIEGFRWAAGEDRTSWVIGRAETILGCLQSGRCDCVARHAETDNYSDQPVRSDVVSACTRKHDMRSWRPRKMSLQIFLYNAVKGARTPKAFFSADEFSRSMLYDILYGESRLRYREALYWKCPNWRRHPENTGAKEHRYFPIPRCTVCNDTIAPGAAYLVNLQRLVVEAPDGPYAATNVWRCGTCDPLADEREGQDRPRDERIKQNFDVNLEICPRCGAPHGSRPAKGYVWTSVKRLGSSDEVEIDVATYRMYRDAPAYDRETESPAAQTTEIDETTVKKMKREINKARRTMSPPDFDRYLDQQIRLFRSRIGSGDGTGESR